MAAAFSALAAASLALVAASVAAWVFSSSPATAPSAFLAAASAWAAASLAGFPISSRGTFTILPSFSPGSDFTPLSEVTVSKSSTPVELWSTRSSTS
nr:hypothetical protein [Parabacteroides distasonis]